MQFAQPNMLWLLLVIPPAMLAFYVWSGRKRRELVAAFIQARLLPTLLAGASETRRKIRFGLLVVAVCLLIVALARPQWGFTWEEVRQRGLDIVVAIDVSKSMLAEDIKPNRLTRAKLAALDLMQQARSDRLALVAFAGSAFLQCPLTIDDSVFRQSVESLDVNAVSRGGTAISAAIETAMGAFTETDNYKVLVLFTDGEDHDSGALDTARQAATKGLEIFTIGLGTPEGELLRVKDPSGRIDFVRDENGNVVKSHLNERILQELSGVTQRGFYLPLRGPKAIDALYAKGLAPIPKTESGEKLVKRHHEQYRWPLSLAILLLIAEMLFPERPRKKAKNSRGKTTPIRGRKAVSSITSPAPTGANSLARPAPTHQVSVLAPLGGLRLSWLSLASLAPWRSCRRCVHPVCVIVALTLFVPSEQPALASTGSALREYQDGDYDKALHEYNRLLQRKPDDSELHFNAGAAAYKHKEYQEAAKHFDQAAASQDLNLQQQAYYNRGNATFQLGQSVPDPQKKSELWQRSLKDFESALKLTDKDADAAHNRDFVKRKLEELKQQQQQQQNQKNKNQNKDQQDQQQQQQQQQNQNQKQDQQQQQQQQQQNQNQDQQQQNQPDQQKQPGQDQKSDQQKQNQEQPGQSPQDQNQEQQQKNQSQPDKNKSDQEQSPGEQQQAQEQTAPGQMTPAQARQLLDAEKGDEKVLQLQPKEASRSRALKDW